MSDLSPERQEHLGVLQHLLRRESILSGCVDLLDAAEFFGDDADCAFVYALAEYIYKRDRVLLTLDYLLPDVARFFAQTDDHGQPVVDTSLRDSLEEAIRAATTRTEWMDAHTTGMLREQIKKQQLRKIMQLSQPQDDPSQVVDDLQRLSLDLKRDPFAKLSISNPFDDIMQRSQRALRFPLGVPFLDYVLDGGACRGETIGIVAPSGGGKTTICMQLAGAQVLRERHVVYLATEQALDGDMSIRSYVLATGCKRSDLAGPASTWPPAIMAALEKARANWLKYFHYVDCTGDGLRSVEELFIPVQELQKQGCGPVVVILDWWGRLRTKLILNNAVKSDQLIRLNTSEWLTKFKRMAGQYDVVNVVTQQLSGAEAQKGAGHRPSSHGAQDDKNFNNMLDFGFVLSKLTGDSRATLYADKARAVARREAQIQLVGEHCRFQIAEDPDAEGLRVSAPVRV